MTTWSEDKRESNRRKHGVDLALAARFEFATALIAEDCDVAHEQRFRAIGFIGSKLYFLVYAENEDGEPRAISLRLADKREKRIYVENL